jgi:hypothetical protein
MASTKELKKFLRTYGDTAIDSMRENIICHSGCGLMSETTPRFKGCQAGAGSFLAKKEF